MIDGQIGVFVFSGSLCAGAVLPVCEAPVMIITIFSSLKAADKLKFYNFLIGYILF